jgi:hypothetical protein
VREDKFNCYVSPENFSSLYSYYQKSDSGLRWEPLFVIPTWLQTWWDVLGSGFTLQLLAIYKDNQIIGIAPLKVKEKIASIIGSDDVSDYLDFFVLSGRRIFSVLVCWNISLRKISAIWTFIIFVQNL